MKSTHANNERHLAIVRLVFCGLIALHIVGVCHESLLEGSIQAIASLGLAVLTSLFSVFVLVRNGQFRGLQLASVSIDGVMIFFALLLTVVFPTSSFVGILRSPDFAFLLICVITAALRLSWRLAVFAVVLNATSFGVLVAIDPAHFDARMFSICIVYFIGAASLAVIMALRSRRLLFEGAEAVLRAERARRNLSLYLPEEVADEALEQSQINLGGVRRNVTVLFCDLRGFTTYAEPVSPEQLVSELNGYLSAMVTAIREHGGTVDKFIGDAIMVVFGASGPKMDDPVRAILTARCMQRALRQHNLERVARGLPRLSQGIGIHSGSAIVGNVGAADCMQHTVIGDVVNIASRLESATKDLDVPVLISASTLNQALRTRTRLPEMHSLGSILIRGRTEASEVYCFADDGLAEERKLKSA